ncbi:MAG: translation initiation factor IF-2 [Chloroflexi bacterium]|nr:translation initiation factor IF-2 [Chloroflexota bacterium]
MVSRARPQPGPDRGQSQQPGTLEDGVTLQGSAPAVVQEARVLELPSALTVRQLAETMEASPVEVIKQLMRRGVMAAINQVINYETAAQVAGAFGFSAKRHEAESPTGVALKEAAPEDDPSRLTSRPPVITILGHVDHGKTTLLDALRQSDLASREVGGITQRIGAYQVEYKDHKLTFLDTPGHEAFTAMRARGAQVTDIAVLVVAADDGIMPQTEEAIDHAKAANVPIVLAINKIDLPGANPERVKRQAAEMGLVPEEWGGDTVTVQLSAKQRKGIDDLLDNLLVVAEVLDLKANSNRLAQGVVIEANLDKSKGPVATVLIQNGTLRIGDNVVVGTASGRIKAMITDRGRRVRTAEPATAVEILGLGRLPEAGDRLVVVSDEHTARALAEERLQEAASQKAVAQTLALAEASSRIQAGEMKDLPLVLKCDVQGSVEAVKNALARISSDKANVKIIHSGAGTITESDVLLAIASQAIVVGFTTKVEPGAQRLADHEGVEIRLYNVIYNLTEDLEKALGGLLEPVVQEVVEGKAEVKAVFGVGKQTKVAGCLVLDGRLRRGAKAQVLRGDSVLFRGTITSLRRFKEDAREVPAGTECGVGIEGFTDFQAGDLLVTHQVTLA